MRHQGVPASGHLSGKCLPTGAVHCWELYVGTASRHGLLAGDVYRQDFPVGALAHRCFPWALHLAESCMHCTRCIVQVEFDFSVQSIGMKKAMGNSELVQSLALLENLFCRAITIAWHSAPSIPEGIDIYSLCSIPERFN